MEMKNDAGRSCDDGVPPPPWYLPETQNPTGSLMFLYAIPAWSERGKRHTLIPLDIFACSDTGKLLVSVPVPVSLLLRGAGGHDGVPWAGEGSQMDVPNKSVFGSLWTPIGIPCLPAEDETPEIRTIPDNPDCSVLKTTWFVLNVKTHFIPLPSCTKWRRQIPGPGPGLGPVW